MKRILPVLVAALVLVSGCASQTQTTVDGAVIPASQINAMLTAQEQLMGLTSGQGAQINALRLNIVNKLKDQILLANEAKKEGLTVSPQTLQAQYTQTLSEWNSNPEEKQSLEAQGYTKGNMQDMVYNQLLIQALADKLASVSPDNISQYYKAHLAQFSTYTVQRLEAKSEAGAMAQSKNLPKQKPLTMPFSQLPFTIQQDILQGQQVVGLVKTAEINPNLFWALEIKKIDPIPLVQVESQVVSDAKGQARIEATQTLLNKLTQQSK